MGRYAWVSSRYACPDSSATAFQDFIKMHEDGIPVTWPLNMQVPFKRLRRKTGFSTKVNCSAASGYGDPAKTDSFMSSTENVSSASNPLGDTALADLQELHNTGGSVVWPTDAPIKLRRLWQNTEVEIPMSPN